MCSVFSIILEIFKPAINSTARQNFLKSAIFSFAAAENERFFGLKFFCRSKVDCGQRHGGSDSKIGIGHSTM